MDDRTMKTGAKSQEFTSKIFRRGGFPAGFAVTVVTALLLLLTACEPQEQHFQPPPPPEVTVAKPVQRTVTDFAEYTGTTTAYASVDIRARVEGYLIKMAFEPGERVKKGQLLFEIDPKPFQAALEGAQAQLETANAELDLATATLTRKERAYKENAVSEVEVLEARAEQKKAKASILAGQAAVDDAKINLGYTKISAPIEGKVTRNLVDVENLVGDGQATLLANIMDDDPIYAYFNISETDLLYYMKMSKEDKTLKNAQGYPMIYLGLSDEKGYPHEGYIDYTDNKIDTGTGTIQLRGVFQNAKNTLLPGLFVRLRIPLAKITDALLIQEDALASDQGGRYALVVNDQDMVEYRKVTVGALEDGMRVITEGIKPDDRVIVNGLQRARPGAKVTVSDGKKAPAATAAKPEGGASEPAKENKAEEKKH